MVWARRLFVASWRGILLIKRKKKVLLVPADTFRPAAKKQLSTLASRVQVECFDSNLKKAPEKIVSMALKDARAKELDVMIVDTAGRLHGDDDLMQELARIKKSLASCNLEVLMIADAMAGQEAGCHDISFSREDWYKWHCFKQDGL